MLVNLIEVKISEKEALKSLLKKVPLLSKVIQFNNSIKDLKLKYVEYKILKYKINKIENDILKSEYRIILLNTYTGHAKVIDDVPSTVKRYIAKDCVEKSKINDCILKSNVIEEIEKKYRKYDNEKLILSDVYSIYKAYWTCNYNGKNIFLDA